MEILKVFRDIWDGIDYPFLIYKEKELRFSQVINQKINSLSEIENGDVVAIIGDFDPKTILTFLKLINKKVIIVPLTIDTKSQHDYFLKAASVNVVIHGSAIKRLTKKKHELVIELNKKKHAGIDQKIIDAPPTDGLWNDARTDEAQLGMTYLELEKAMANNNDPNYKKYLEIRKRNLHKMNPIPVCKFDNE